MRWLSVDISPTPRLPVPGGDARARPPDFGAGELEERRAGARSGDLRRCSPKCSARHRPAVSGVRDLWTGYVGLRHVKAENDDAEATARSARRSSCSSSARSPTGRARSSSCSSFAIRSTLQTAAARHHRRRGDAGLPHRDDRQRDARRPPARHGGDRAGRRRRPRRGAERARREDSAAHRSQRRGRRARSSDRARRASSSAAATNGCGWTTSPKSRTSSSATWW